MVTVWYFKPFGTICWLVSRECTGELKIAKQCITLVAKPYVANTLFHPIGTG